MGHFWTWCYFLLLNITPCGLMDNSYRVISLSMFGNSTLRWKPKLLCGAFSFPGWKSAVMLVKPRWEVKGGKAQVLSVSSTVHSVCSLWLWMMNLKIINRTVLCVEECGDIWQVRQTHKSPVTMDNECRPIREDWFAHLYIRSLK